MNVICYPSKLSGTVAAIPSKSDAHRKLICTALSDNGGFLPLKAPFCDDIAATIRCLRALGAGFESTPDGLRVTPVCRQPEALLDCGESGSTLRFLLPVAMCVCPKITVTGSGRLPERPIGALTELMSTHGVQFSADKLPLAATGTLSGGICGIAGNISSQFLSGLLMALPLCDTDSEIRLTTELQSADYVKMTLDTLRLFGANIQEDTQENGFLCYRIHSGMLHAPENISIDGDWSNAAFWLVAGAIQSEAEITATGLNGDSIQGDKKIAEILQNAGASITGCNGSYTVKQSQMRAFSAEMNAIPDLLPILAVRAACGTNTVQFTRAERLRLKESDRLSATAELLRNLGGRADEHPDGLTVYGGQLTGGTVDGMNDHRLVMAAAIAAVRCNAPVKILGAGAVAKSYPAFWEDYRSLGGKIEFEE